MLILRITHITSLDCLTRMNENGAFIIHFLQGLINKLLDIILKAYITLNDRAG